MFPCGQIKQNFIIVRERPSPYCRDEIKFAAAKVATIRISSTRLCVGLTIIEGGDNEHNAHYPRSVLFECRATGAWWANYC
jgi:hypothetical protein